MKSLINDLDASVGKTPFQSYTLTHGIEKLTVLVPLKNAKVFEADFEKAKDKSKNALLEVINSHGGKVK